jgi:hypothetical protein
MSLPTVQGEPPGLRGFSEGSLKKMRRFYEKWSAVFSNRSLTTNEFEPIQNPNRKMKRGKTEISAHSALYAMITASETSRVSTPSSDDVGVDNGDDNGGGFARHQYRHHSEKPPNLKWQAEILLCQASGNFVVDKCRRRV